MGFLMEALLLEMCTEERICVLIYWEKVTKRLDRAFSRRWSCVCQNPEVKVHPWSSDLLAHSSEIQLFEGKDDKSVSDYVCLLLLSAKSAKIPWTSIWRILILNIEAVHLEFRGWVAFVPWVPLDHYFENCHKFGQVISFRKIINCT